jgi:hypothetical protein
MRISCELEIFLRDMMRVAAYFDVRSIRFVRSRQRIRASPIVRRPTAHPFILTWSHFDFPISIRLSDCFPIVFRRKLSRIWRGKTPFTPSRHSNGLISSHPKYGHERSLSSRSRANSLCERCPHGRARPTFLAGWPLRRSPRPAVPQRLIRVP